MYDQSDRNGFPDGCDEDPLASIRVTRDTPWRTMTGEIVTVATMTDNHLLNCIRMMRGQSPIGTHWYRSPAYATRRREWVNVMANEAYRRGLALDPILDGEPVHE